MNWITRIKYILGSFWNSIFKDTEFLAGIINTLSLYGKLQEASHNNWAEGFIVGASNVHQDGFPVSVYIPVNSIRAPYNSFEGILNGDTLGEAQANAGWVADTLYPIADTYCLTDHVVEYTRVLYSGFDYKYSNGRFLFYVDPRLLGLPIMKLVDEDGELQLYFVLFGWRRRYHANKEAVAGLLGQNTGALSAEAWAVHQTGATYYNVKELLGKATASVICKADGAVNAVWEEQGHPCIQVGNSVYSAPPGTMVNYSKGDNVSKGDILLGDMRFTSGKNTPPTEDVPGIRVRTDAGELVAQNTLLAYAYNPEDPESPKILPLTGGALTVNNYRETCYRLSQDLECPYTLLPEDDEAPGLINAFDFIMRVVRRGRGCFASLTANKLQDIRPALGVIRNSICTSGILNVFVKTSGDVAGVTVSGFTADAGNAAVSVDATITIKEASADIEVFI